MAGIIHGVEGIWDAAVSAVTRVVERVQYRANQQQQVAEYTQASGERFRIEPADVPQVIADLRSALDKVRDIRTQAQAIAFTPAPGSDEVSRNAVRQIGQMAMGSEGSLKAALDAYEIEIVKTINKLEADLRAYLRTEELNVPPASVWP
ncbi:MAG TPA: hypothetical protein VGD67_18480 [Pseudonocardiaceae bacterium]